MANWNIIFLEELIMNKLPERLKELREEKAMSQSQLATELKVGQSTIARWESGKRIPNIDDAIKIAQYFGVATDYLFGLED